ncbi:hypothetical protein [Thetidibacter halocola]|uniref:TolC family protein n=1 Tax=Thetidibacter halocola TaxID=2827239 RepID=A0A8J7WI01_9RHOB|nr:hypothetical protein [Thetidibacter halocola]MBS0125394.1 hypothetical protein [Thetidibacter halocola]
MKTLFLSMLMLAAFWPGTAVAQDTIVDRRYSSDKLDTFWASTLGAEAPDASLFDMMVPGTPDSVEPVTDAAPDFGLPGLGQIIGETATSGAGQGTRLAFPVIPLAPEEAAVLHRRLAFAELYLGRYEFYERASTDTAAILDGLTRHQVAAGLEAYLSYARLYFAQPTMTEKCRMLRRIRALSAGVLSTRGTVDVPAGWEALLPIQVATAERLEDSPLAALVCSVEPVRGRGETVRIVETRVRETVAAEARAKVEDSLVLLDAAAAEFQDLVNRMDVEIKSAEILDLERRFGNAAANLRLVKEDGLNADVTIAELNAVDLSTLRQPGQLQDLETAQARMSQMAERMRTVLNQLAALADVTADPALSLSLFNCAQLRGLYQNLDFQRDTGVLTASIQGPYDACLTSARTVASSLTAPSLQAAFMAELAHHVRRLSENLLESQR